MRVVHIYVKWGDIYNITDIQKITWRQCYLNPRLFSICNQHKRNSTNYPLFPHFYILLSCLPKRNRHPSSAFFPPFSMPVSMFRLSPCLFHSAASLYLFSANLFSLIYFFVPSSCLFCWIFLFDSLVFTWLMLPYD